MEWVICQKKGIEITVEAGDKVGAPQIAVENPLRGGCDRRGFGAESWPRRPKIKEFNKRREVQLKKLR